MNRKKIIAAASSAAVITVFCIWQNNSIVISEYSYQSSEVGPSFDGFKILQISDLHNKKFGTGQSRIIKK